MRTFTFGILTASILALIVGIGLQYVQFPAAKFYSTKHTRLQ